MFDFHPRGETVELFRWVGRFGEADPTHGCLLSVSILMDALRSTAKCKSFQRVPVATIRQQTTLISNGKTKSVCRTSRIETEIQHGIPSTRNRHRTK